jgi:hypothetical protein
MPLSEALIVCEPVQHVPLTVTLYVVIACAG